MAPLTREEISAFAAEWYRKLDEHVPADDVISMVAERDLEFHLPETVLRTTDDFRRWYSGGGGLPGVINVFFDETHALSQVDSSWSDERALVKVVVNWQARRWTPPAPRSQWVGFDVYQAWEMVRSISTGRPVITRYLVNEMRPKPGSPAL